MPYLDAKPSAELADGPPWEWATELARLARLKWDLGCGQVSNEKLASLLGAKSEMLTSSSVSAALMPLAIRAGSNGHFDLYFNRSRSTTRRFAAGRLLGDCLQFASQEKLHPATRSKTARQKFQRAFAQEFLCPIDALMDRLPTGEPDEDDIAEAAAYFDVSSLMVRTTLVNKGQLDREALAWSD